MATAPKAAILPDLSDEGWDTVYESPATIIFDTVGDTFTGIYSGIEDVTPEKGEAFSRYLFRGVTGEQAGQLYAVNMAYQLRQAMEGVDEGTLTRIILVELRADADPKSTRSPLKVFKVQTKRS